MRRSILVEKKGRKAFAKVVAGATIEADSIEEEPTSEYLFSRGSTGNM